MDTLFHIDCDHTERCCRTCAHAMPRHGVVKRGMHPLVCLLYGRAVPYVCGDGTNDIIPRYPCHVRIDVTGEPVPAGWEARDE